METNLHLEIRRSPDKVVVRAVGELDIANRDVITDALDALAPDTHVVVDLREADYVGIGALDAIQLTARRIRRHDGSFEVRVAGQRLRRLARLLGWRELAAAISVSEPRSGDADGMADATFTG